MLVNVVVKNWGKLSVFKGDRIFMFGEYGFNMIEGNIWVCYRYIIIFVFFFVNLKVYFIYIIYIYLFILYRFFFCLVEKIISYYIL